MQPSFVRGVGYYLRRVAALRSQNCVGPVHSGKCLAGATMLFLVFGASCKMGGVDMTPVYARQEPEQPTVKVKQGV